MQLAHRIGKPYREGFVKNRYVGRTFIMPGQGVRKKSVRQKLNAIGMEFKGRNVLLVDDSIVRGTTSKEIVQMAREAGARKVYMASAAPPVRFPNVYGIDMPTKEELIAHDRSIEEIRAVHRCRRADLPGRGRDEARGRRAQPAGSTVSRPAASTASTSPATSAPRTSPSMERQRRLQFDGDEGEGEDSPRSRLALQGGGDRRHDDAARRPAARRCGLDTLAVREGLPRTPWGENSEALFLTSSFVHPDAATAAARFANEEEAFVYSRFGNPDGDDDGAPAGRAGRQRAAASAPPAAWRRS